MTKNNSSLNGFQKRTSVFHALMPFKVREILLVSSLYDAYIIEEEGLISELIIGQYRHLLLTSPPHVTRVRSGEKALTKLKEHHYDLVITMSKNIGMDPYEFGSKIKDLHPELPVILLAIGSDDVRLVEQEWRKSGIDKAFFWTGDPTLFLAIIKYVEDSVNARYDTINGDVRILIMLEDSVHYYSMLLPILYTEIVRQTQRSLSDDLNEMQRLLTRRARPKILLAETFEEGVALFDQYKEYVLGIFADVTVERGGKEDPEAGFEFARHVRGESEFTPLLIQSSDPGNRKTAESLGTVFLNKNSPTLIQEIQSFFLSHLGFGDFVFLQPVKKKGKEGETRSVMEEVIEIGRASNMTEFVQKLQEVPIESIQYHAERNHFSDWLFARCEFRPALELRPKRASDFTDLGAVKKHLLEVFNESRREKQLGIISDFSQQQFEFDSSFTRLTGDSIGGKGRGIAFMRKLLVRYDLQQKYPGITITVPSTVVLGTLEYDRFVTDNDLWKLIEREDITDHEIAAAFLRSKLDRELRGKLSKLLDHFRTPLAIRSSALLEDSHYHPFAGLYSTYMLPNNHRNKDVRLKQLSQAIRLVYASVFFREARSYIDSTSANLEEEKMAVIIQELVGTDYGGRFYPAFSGVAQSYNFYPVSHQKSEDGIVSVGVGLGRTVVGGEKVLRFSPRHPSVLPDFSTTERILRNSQRELYVLDTSVKDFQLFEQDDVTLKKLNVTDIREDGTLDLVASTYDRDDGIIRDGIPGEGPVLVTFAGVLKYEQFPLASIIRDVLKIGRGGMGSPVEIEFAVDVNEKRGLRPTFAILQLRPLSRSYELCDAEWGECFEENEAFITSETALGNGIMDSIRDIVYVRPDRFDPAKTLEIAEEVGRLNSQLAGSRSPYLLIGPGRWGTQDRWLGVPVRWSQISGVAVLVETALEDFNVEPSQGTHFFHNIVSRGIGYINTTVNSDTSHIDWPWLQSLEANRSLEYVTHVKLPSPLTVKIDGRCGRAVVEKPSP